MRRLVKNIFISFVTSDSSFRSHKALGSLCGIFAVLIACVSLARADVPPTNWCALVRQQDTWTKAPSLDKKTEVLCHFFGLGKYKVLIKNGDHTTSYTLEALADYMPVTFVRLVGTGESEIMIQSVPDARYPKPTFTGLIAISDAAYNPDPLDLKYPLYARFRNVSDEDTKIQAVGVGSGLTGAYTLGMLSAQGFGGPGVLKAHETSVLVSLSHNLNSRTVFWFTLIDGTSKTAVDIDFYSDPAGTKLMRTVSFRGNNGTSRVVIFYPQPDNTLTSSTPAEIFRRDQEALDAAEKADPSFRRPLPKKAWVSTSIGDSGEEMETLINELNLNHRVGANSTSQWPTTNRIKDKLPEMGYVYGWDMATNFIPVSADFKFDKAAADAYAKGAHSSGAVSKKTVIMLTDEPIYREIEKNAALDARMRAWMQAKGMTPVDAGCATWDDVKVIAPSKTNKRLSVVSRAFQVDQYVECFAGFAKAYSDISPNFLPAVNWGMGEYMDGLKMDMWEMYKRPGYGAVWAEDWYGYEPENAGAIAWYADLMRSQQKYRSLPMGTYPIVGYGYGPTLTTIKYYERMMRGCTMFETYSYSPRSNDASWIEQPTVVLNLARLHRDLAAVEDILIGGKVVPAKIALLYPNSSMVWDESAARDAQALYTAYLQANIPIDVVTEQDVVDGYLKNYPMVLAAGRNIRTDAMKALDTYIRTGGTLVWSAPDVRDQYDEPYPNGSLIVGAKSLVNQVDGPLGRWLYEMPNAKAIDTVNWDGKQIPIYVKKSRIEPQPQATVLATFADGSPAITKTARGKGTVYLYAFSPGLGYMKADFEGKNNVLATALSGNDDQRALATMPGRTIDNGIEVDKQMISTRAVVNGNTALVGLVDYGVGEVGRKTKNPDSNSIDLEKMDPYPVNLSIACSPKPTKVYGIRSGVVTSTYANGVLQVQVPLRGVDMIVLNGTQLVK